MIIEEYIYFYDWSCSRNHSHRDLKLSRDQTPKIKSEIFMSFINLVNHIFIIFKHKNLTRNDKNIKFYHIFQNLDSFALNNIYFRINALGLEKHLSKMKYRVV